MEIDIITRIDIHIFAILICIVIWADIHTQDIYWQHSSRIYLLLLQLCIFSTTLEAATWLLRGQVTQQFNFIFNTLYFMITPLPQLFWSLYVEKQFFWKKGKFHNLLPKLCLPVLISEIMLLINCFYPFIFGADPSGRYYRLWGYPLLMVICYSLFGYTLIRIIYGRNQLGPNLFWSLVIFHLPPLIGGLLQGFMYGTSFIWPGTALALLIGYINIQNKRLVTDYLTGAYNRREMDRYMSQRISGPRSPAFWGILIDIDNFKEINDNCGHVIGDEVLIKTVKLLQSSITPRDFLARYGGDEFFIILNEENTDKIKRTITRIEYNIEKFNQRSNYPFKLSLSLGYDLYDVTHAMDVTEFLKHIDRKMYKTKHNKSK